MSLLRYYARVGGDQRVINAVAGELRAKWDPTGEFEAPDGTRWPEAHAAAILGMLAAGDDTAGVKGYLRLAEEAALGTARSTSRERGDLAEGIWRLMVDAAVAASTRSE